MEMTVNVSGSFGLINSPLQMSFSTRDIPQGSARAIAMYSLSEIHVGANLFALGLFLGAACGVTILLVLLRQRKRR